MDPLTDLGVAVAGEVATSSLAEIKKHVGYLYHYKDNLKALEEAKRQLDAKRSDANKFSAKAESSVRDVSDTVQLWKSDAEKLDQMAVNIISKTGISFLNLRSRYSLSKQALLLAQNIDEKVKNAPYFDPAVDRQIAEGARFDLRGYMECESRRRIQDEVLDALRRDDVTMCSICGMGGIGKTTLAKKLVKKVEAGGLFEKVAMVTVSQKPDFEKNQKEIIDSLGLDIGSDTMQGRAKKLNDWLSNHKTLLILDDVWQQIKDDDFEKVGIPVASNRCKIVFTSRNIEECKKMRCGLNIPLNVLDDTEAWELFRQNAGECLEERKFEELARQIVDECKGLPIAIVTIAKALKDKPLGAWDDSLKKLQNSNLPEISDMDEVHSKIKVSYDLLEDPEAQSCLRLCCLFPEDYNVPVEKLVFYGWGLGIFGGVDRLKEARDRVDLIVHKLKSSFLLLDGEREVCVKLHDIVRDFAIWISSKDENPYLVRCENEMGKWPEKFQCEKSGAISFVCKEIKNHTASLRCPNLKLLHLHSKNCLGDLPNGFFDEMEELRVVDVHVPSKFPPLTMQKALKTLLFENVSHKIVPLGEGYMENLEIFSLYPWKSLSGYPMELSEFPMEIRFMRNLRCFRFFEAPFTYMPPGVLSNLVKLEELELQPAFSSWGLQEKGRTNASLDEIELLPLTSITIGLRKESILADNIVKSITRFRIFIECNGLRKLNFDSNVLEVRKVNACDALVKWTSSLMRKCHHLELESVDLLYIMSQQLRGSDCYQIECFSQLKILRMWSMNSLKEIVNGTYLSNRKQPCFTNLTTIEIEYCPKLKRAFPLSVARELTQLEFMRLKKCREMEEVFYDDQGDSGNQAGSSVKLNATSKGKQLKHIPKDQNMEERIEKAGEREVDREVVLPRLEQLYLNKMNELRFLYNGHHAIECPSIKYLKIIDSNDMEYLAYESGDLIISKMKGHLKNISKWLPFALENGIQRVKELAISRCREMKYLADAIELEGPTILRTFFSNLKKLVVGHMDNLEEICHGPYLSKIHAQCFSNLILLDISHCPKMKHLFPLSVAKELRKLQHMKIETCEEIEEILYKCQVDDENQVAPSVRLNNLIVEKSSICCPTPTSFIQCLLPKGKQPKHLPSPQIMEENTTDSDQNEVDCATADAVVIFPQLKIVTLSELHKLRTFYDGNHAIELPSLEFLTIIHCEEMRALSNGSFKAPNLESMWVDRAKKNPSATEDLNAILRKTDEEKDKDRDENEDTARTN